MGAGVYAYTDIMALLEPFDFNDPKTTNYVIGVVHGYLHKVGQVTTKVSLDPRSCKLIGFFAQIHVPAGVPFTLGEEDKLSLRLGPEELGVFA